MQDERNASGVNARRRQSLWLGFTAYDEQDCGYRTPCWIYRKTPTAHGYAQMKMADGRQPAAHRAFYEHYVRPIPAGLVIDHLCEVKRCVNPAHLEPVTGAENTRRSRVSKLTMDKAREIRRRHADGEQQKHLAAFFGVSRATVCAICKGTQWAE